MQNCIPVIVDSQIHNSLTLSIYLRQSHTQFALQFSIMPPLKRQTQPQAISSGGGGSSGAAASSSARHAPSQGALLSMPLDVLRVVVWPQLSPEDHRAMRILNKRMRREISKWFKKVRFTLPAGRQHARPLARQLARFPLLEELRLTAGPGATGWDLDNLFHPASDRPFRSRAAKLQLDGFNSLLWAASYAFPASLASSMTTLNLSGCTVHARGFAVLTSCIALRTLQLRQVTCEYGSLTSLPLLTQVFLAYPCSGFVRQSCSHNSMIVRLILELILM